jgi:ribosomal protein L11 methylase PrmA
MRRWVARLDWSPPRSVWVGYNGNNSYTDADARRKDEFVRAVTSARPWSLVWDLGANAGRHSRIAAETAATVVAMDADPGTVELLYRRLRTEGNRTVLPLTVDLADLSPGIGWRNRERRPLTARGRPDLVLALAVVHHLAITANVPLAEIVHWFADLGAVLVVEFPTRDDPMVQRLLRNKRPGLHSDYRREVFEWTLKETFDVLRVTPLEDSPTRVLYHAVPKAGAARC